MKRITIISYTLILLAISSVIVTSISSLNNFFETIELSEEAGSSDNNEFEEEDEENAIFYSSKKIVFVQNSFNYFSLKLVPSLVYLETLTQPPNC